LAVRLPQQLKRRHHQALQLISIKLSRPYPIPQTSLAVEIRDRILQSQPSEGSIGAGNKLVMNPAWRCAQNGDTASYVWIRTNDDFNSYCISQQGSAIKNTG
jgi:hypothetical protein